MPCIQWRSSMSVSRALKSRTQTIETHAMGQDAGTTFTLFVAKYGTVPNASISGHGRYWWCKSSNEGEDSDDCKGETHCVWWGCDRIKLETSPSFYMLNNLCMHFRKNLSVDPPQPSTWQTTTLVRTYTQHLVATGSRLHLHATYSPKPCWHDATGFLGRGDPILSCYCDNSNAGMGQWLQHTTWVSLNPRAGPRAMTCTLVGMTQVILYNLISNDIFQGLTRRIINHGCIAYTQNKWFWHLEAYVQREESCMSGEAWRGTSALPWCQVAPSRCVFTVIRKILIFGNRL